MQHPSVRDPDPIVQREVARMLDGVPAYHQLDGATRASLADSLAQIGTVLARGGAEPLAGQLAPVDLRSRIGAGAPGSARPGGQPVPSGRPGAMPPPPAQSGGAPSTGTTGRVGEVARATLNAIDFPSFVASLIQGTFKAIVDASIQQMEAYAELLRNVANTVDQFMAENVTDGMARDYLTDQYEGLFTRDSSGGTPRLRVNAERVPEGELPSFFKDLGFDSADDLDEESVEQVVVPATRRTMAERRQQTLATMVLMGINRVVVDEGEITAKLQFHIDASETTALRFDQTKTTTGNIARGGRSPFAANAIMVNTTSLNAQSDINVRADLTGQVKVKFRSETFPLDRFADSLAIQLINEHARVPAPTAPPTPGMAAPGTVPGPPPAAAPALPGAAVPAPTGTRAAPAAPAPPPAAPPPAGAAQSVASDDPWAPR